MIDTCKIFFPIRFTVQNTFCAAGDLFWACQRIAFGGCLGLVGAFTEVRRFGSMAPSAAKKEILQVCLFFCLSNDPRSPTATEDFLQVSHCELRHSSAISKTENWEIKLTRLFNKQPPAEGATQSDSGRLVLCLLLTSCRLYKRLYKALNSKEASGLFRTLAFTSVLQCHVFLKLGPKQKRNAYKPFENHCQSLCQQDGGGGGVYVWLNGTLRYIFGC